MGEAVQDGMILVQTAGARVGQVNGLAVYDFGDHRFGKAARISAAVGTGRVGVVNVERLSALSGSSHDKGVLILAGWLRATFAAERPAAFTASIVFEQSYGGVEGDSATCAEAVAIVSALAGLPVRQDLAITGSMNQLGDVQPVGAVTVGLNVAHAVQNTLYLEQAALQQIWAATLGTPEVLEDRLIAFQKDPPRGEGGLALWYTKRYYDTQKR